MQHTNKFYRICPNNKNLDSQNEGFTVFGHLLGDGIKDPLLLNNQTIYNVNYEDISLNIPQLPLVNLQGNVIYDTNYFAIHTISIISQRLIEIENVFNVIVAPLMTQMEIVKSMQHVIIEVQDIQGSFWRA